MAKIKSEFVTIGYAYRSSWYAGHFKAPNGCWYFHTMDSAWNVANETGPFNSPQEAMAAARKCFPELPIPPGHIDWIRSFNVQVA